MLTEAEIKRFIDNDSSSEKKKFAEVGQRYYEANHGCFITTQMGTSWKTRHAQTLKSVIRSSLN